MGALLTAYRNMRIHKKIMVVLIPIVVLPLLVVVFTSNHIFSVSTIQKTKVNMSGESSIIATRIQSIYSNAETSSRILVKNINRIYEDLGLDPSGTNGDVSFRNQLFNEFNFNLRAFKDIESIAFIDMQNNIFASDNRLNNNLDKAFDSPIVQMLLSPGVALNIWFPMQQRDYLVTDPKSPVLTVGKRVVDIETGTTLGSLILNLKESTISSIFPDTGTESDNDFYIADQYGTIVSTRNRSELLKHVSSPELFSWLQTGKDGSSIQLTLNHNRYLIMKKNIPELNWTLYKQMLVKDLTKEKYTNSVTIMVVGLLCVIIAMAGSYALSRHITMPIVLLTRTAKLIREGNLNVASPVGFQDEVGILASTFNEMIARINELLHRVTAEQRKKREYEFALIQAQIKPHFFYNTLDLIYVLCEKGKTELAADTTKALADFYRVSLSRGREIITIREELKNAADYLFIQKTRYSDVIDFSMDVQEDILDYSIMKLTVQPLIENAIYHGLKPRLSRGKIEIRGFAEQQNIVLQVIDNGVGFDADELKAQLLNPERATSSSFGLKSVNERIKLYFGEPYGVRIESSPGEGTVITITIPQTREGAEA